MSLYSFLADLVVVVHALYVGVVVFGLLLIWIGLFCRWQWVRSFWFRGPLAIDRRGGGGEYSLAWFAP